VVCVLRKKSKILQKIKYMASPSSTRRAASLPVSSARGGGGSHESPSATQRMFFELTETSPVELPKHLRYKSPLRAKQDSPWAGTHGRYLEPKHPPPEPAPILGTPDLVRIHGGKEGYSYSDTNTRVMDYLQKEKTPPASSFVPLEKTEGVRFDPEVQKMKEYAASKGFAGESKYEQHTIDKVHFEEGKSPRDLAEVKRKERLGIHPRTFRPVSEVCAKTFDEYASMAKVWKKTHGLEEEEKKSKKMERPSTVMEYVRHSTPILSRSGKPMTPTGQEKARLEELRRKPRQEFHFVPTPFGGDFTQGPGSDRPKGYKAGVKVAFNRERELVQQLAERLSGKSPAKYSPAHLIQLATPISVQRAIAEEKAMLEAERKHQEELKRQEEAQRMQQIVGATNATADGSQQQKGVVAKDDVSYTTRKLDMNNNNSNAVRGTSPSPSATARGRSPGVTRAATPSGPQKPRHWR
jgi:hypothetical protein